MVSGSMYGEIQCEYALSVGEEGREGEFVEGEFVGSYLLILK